MFTTHKNTGRVSEKDVDVIELMRAALLSNDARSQHDARETLLQYSQAGSSVVLREVIPLLACMLRPEEERPVSWRRVNPEEVINLLLFLTQNNDHNQKIFNAFVESGGLKLLMSYLDRDDPQVNSLFSSCLEVMSYDEIKVAWINEVFLQESKIKDVQEETAQLEKQLQDQRRELQIVLNANLNLLKSAFPTADDEKLQIITNFSQHFPPFKKEGVSSAFKIQVHFLFFGSNNPEHQAVYQYIQNNQQSIYQTSGPLINLYNLIRGWAAHPSDFIEMAAGGWTAAVQEHIPSAPSLSSGQMFFSTESEIKPGTFEITKSP